MADEAEDTSPHPTWYTRMVERYQADKNQFLLDFNVRDKVFVPQQPPSPGQMPDLLRVDEYLFTSLLQSNHFDLVLAYSLTTGIRLISQAAVEPFHLTWSEFDVDRQKKDYQSKLYEKVYKEALKKPDLLEQLGQPKPETLPFDRDPMRAFAFLDRVLTRQYRLPTSSDGAKRPIRIALIVDYLENLAPASQVGHRDQVLLAETLSRWANSSDIRRNGHLIILLTEDINQVSPVLTAGAAGTVNIRLERPDSTQRLAFLKWMHSAGQLPVAEGEPTGTDALASLTAGFNLAELEDLIKYANHVNDGRLDIELIKQRKRDVIRAESRNLLEIVETEIGFDHVGGLTHVKEALNDIATWLKSPAMARLVPKGLFFVGPPGTGKSLVAQALARESGVNMVKLRDVQSMWVGESERNMSRVLDVARAFAPVIVFIDEIDQAYGQRGGGDTTGVSSRLFGKLLEFMGDNANRGRVLWVAASNRPDFVDAALISRFDRVVPFLLPDRANREEILLRAMPKIVHLEWANGPSLADWSAQERAAWDELLAATEEFSGREIELVVRRGVELAEGRELSPVCVMEAVRKFEHSHDRDVYQLQTLLALQVTNFKDYLPNPETLSPVALQDEVTSEVDGRVTFDRQLIQKKIWDLRRNMR